MEFNILPLAEAETLYIKFFNLFQTESEMERNCGYVCVVSFNLVCVSPVSVCLFLEISPLRIIFEEKNRTFINILDKSIASKTNSKCIWWIAEMILDCVFMYTIERWPYINF